MSRRSAIFDLPQEVREELSERLISSGFGGYEGLSDWLADKGFSISKSAIHRYGQGLQEDFDAAMGDVRKAQELARAYASASPDDSQALTGAVAAMAQESLLRIMIGLRKVESDPSETAKQMAQVSRALADLGRLGISQAKHAVEMRKQAAEELAGKVEQEGGAVTPERLRQIMRETYGV